MSFLRRAVDVSLYHIRYCALSSVMLGLMCGCGGTQSDSAPLNQARVLQDEADRHIESKQFKEALEKTERALATRREQLGETHPDVAYSINRRGEIAYYQGDRKLAETLFGQALKTREAALGSDHPDVADSLNNLASMILLRGDYVEPEGLYQRALDICDRASTKRRAQRDRVQMLSAEILNNMGRLFHLRGDYDRAESQYLKALAIREGALGREHPVVSETLANLGGVYYRSKQYDKAAQFLRRAIASQEQRLGPDDPSLATSYYNLAAVHFDNGEYKDAEAFFRRALAIGERTYGSQDPRVATRVLGLAEALRLTGDYPQADAFYERAYAIRVHALGPGHPDVAETLVKRSLLRYATGDFDAAARLLSQGAELREETLRLVLTAGSEDQKRLFLGRLTDETDIAISLHLNSARANAAAGQLALTNILQRKGRSIDSMADQLATLRRHLDDGDRQLLEQLSNAQSRLAAMILKGVATDEQRQSVAKLRSEIQRLEQTISSRSAAYRVTARQPALGEIRAAVPDRTVLIEFASFRPFFVRNAHATAFGAPRYAAYVLRRDGIAAAFDLGEAAVIDRHVERFRASLSNPRDLQQVRDAAGILHRALLAPIQPSLRNVERLILSPDGALNLIPFAALVGSDNKYLIEHFAVSYVTSGRDLTRFRELGSNGSRALAPPAIVADPTFDGLHAGSAAAGTSPGVKRASDESERGLIIRFDPLPGTAQEAEALARVLPDARLYMGARATESALKALTAPSILHIASHGFFRFSPVSQRRGAERAGASASAQQPGRDDRQTALVFSGLALAGANDGWSGDGEDGILTALEVAGLDLWGTRMVVLSACETGVGEARNGEGVYGLRRALVLAGSESQVMSLWKVSDEATRDLMIAYYRRLRSKEGRADALRRVQLSMLRGEHNRAHPFYWAGFIQSGDWRELFS